MLFSLSGIAQNPHAMVMEAIEKEHFYKESATLVCLDGAAVFKLRKDAKDKTVFTVELGKGDLLHIPPVCVNQYSVFELGWLSAYRSLCLQEVPHSMFLTDAKYFKSVGLFSYDFTKHEPEMLFTDS